MVIKTDNGSATKDIIVVLKFIKKMNNIITTNIAPSMRECSILFMELLIKRLCLNVSVDIFTSCGKLFLSSSRDDMILSVSSLVSEFGCFVVGEGYYSQGITANYSIGNCCKVASVNIPFYNVLVSIFI